jgi:DeoR/GlpR family transcriptional regulator of sugar metabolism
VQRISLTFDRGLVLKQTALARFGSVAKWSGLITDGGVSRAQAAALRRAGVNLIVSKSTRPTK